MTPPMPVPCPAAWRPLALLGLLVALPWLLQWIGQDYYIGLATRVLIMALAASSLNLILGYGGMVSLGHGAFLGLGAYAVGVLMYYGVDSAWIAWPAAIAATALFALLMGAVSLRTQGVYFIMITLAFTQMLYFLVVSIKAYGGVDGLNLSARSTVGGPIDLTDDNTFYFVVLAIAALSFAGLRVLLRTRLGWALQGIRDNELRMRALGYRTFRIKLAAFTLAGAAAGLAGALLANQNSFASPGSLTWMQSGVLLVMVLLGGLGRLYGGLIGAALWLVAEEVLGRYTNHWHFVFGFVLLAVVLLAPRGLAGLFGSEPRQ